MRVNLRYLPTPKRESDITLSNLYGGMNLRSDPTECNPSQSPDMLNMWWKDGALRKRNGQSRLYSPATKMQRNCVFFSRLFNGFLFWLEGNRFRYADPENLAMNYTVRGIEIDKDTPRGDFIPFEEYLFYKAPGVYIRFRIDDKQKIPVGEYIINYGDIGRDENDRPFAFTPTITINRNPDGTGGDAYQPENRINPYKRVWFDVDKTSTDYYLPVHGCKVSKVQIDDDVSIENPEGWGDGEYCLVGGRTVSFHNMGVPDDSPLFSFIRLNLPMDVSETGWTSQDYRDVLSGSGHYLSNVVYSTKDVYPNRNTTFATGQTVVGKSEKIQDELFSNLVQKMRDVGPSKRTDAINYYAVFESETTINLAVLNAEGYVASFDDYFAEIRWDNSNRAFRMKDYILYRWNKDTKEITVDDYSGIENKGFHHATKCVYANFNATNSDGTKLFQIPPKPIGEELPIYFYMPLEIASNAMRDATGYYCRYDPMTHDVYTKNIDLYWISEDKNAWVFHYKLPDAPVMVTSVSGDYFGTYGYIMVKVSKSDYSVIGDVVVHPEKSAAGFKASNVTYAAYDMIYYGSAPCWSYNGRLIEGAPIISKNAYAPSSEYAEYIEVARTRAQGKYGFDLTDANYLIASGNNGKYIGVWFEDPHGEFSVMYYDNSTGKYAGNFTAKGYVTETRNTTITDDEVELNLDTPAVLSNRIRVTYIKENKDAFKAISDCKVAIDYGGSDSVCIVMGNCEAQPNAIFWSGNGEAGVDPTYFPMDQYNLVGTYQDPITDLAKYQSFLIILQGHQTSKGTYSIENNTATNRNFIDIAVATINPERGCDCPNTVQLCGNNLVWASKAHGVMYLTDTSYANENAVLRISENVNGNKYRSGLLDSLKNADDICSLDDGQRYYLFCNDELWVWDYSLGGVSDGIGNLSWTRHNGFDVQDATTADTTTIYLLDHDGNINTISDKAQDDFGENFPCHYTSPTQTFGGYYKLIDVVKMILTCSSERGGVFQIKYGTERAANVAKEEYVPLKSSGQLKLVKREFPTGLVLKPRLLHIHNFYFRIESDGRDGGLSIDNAVILYTSGGESK